MKNIVKVSELEIINGRCVIINELIDILVVDIYLEIFYIITSTIKSIYIISPCNIDFHRINTKNIKLYTNQRYDDTCFQYIISDEKIKNGGILCDSNYNRFKYICCINDDLGGIACNILNSEFNKECNINYMWCISI